ncbi:MAG: 3-hydroxyacyl-CoA dehydrogenase NAD-binding domain-containing protein [Chitinophagales bacterium]|nr:3-hydroxyacyl-CoA dehydrogenase NAD-binding domain-containing protein [Chitinophagales bacterium]MDW8419741.1 3-hydroxyacyl-CoA dehydrogenase NAD-binding domain-containing protein [Chitinophagales bacterium]
MKTIQRIGIAGAGAMGQGIAQVFAQCGYEVILYDVNSTQLSKAKENIQSILQSAVSKGKMREDEMHAAMARISFVPNVDGLKGDAIIEAIVEQLEPKRELFQLLAAQNAPDTLLVSNTSSIPITRIAKGIPHPGRIAGLHFFNPAPVMKLVEVIAAADTTPETINTLVALVRNIQKTPVVCKDSPGFIVNRVARHYYVESLKLLEERVADHETIDALMESAGFKLGPFKLMDLVGNDINFAVTSSLYESFHYEPRFRPSRLQQQKVDAGHLGRKSGKGFYNYNSPS